MAKFQSPLLGYNNNVRHRGRLFHIQTEDSGVNHPHIITHVFMDGGRILKSQKRSYAEHVGSDGLSETVKQMMKEQHKAMFIALRDGQFDALVEGAVNGAPAPGAKAPPPKPARTAEAEAKANVAPPAAKPPLAEDAAPQTVAEESAKAPPTDPDGPSTTREVEPPRRPSVKDLTLDFDALERESDDSGAASSLFDAPALPPPPPNLFSSGRNVEAGTGTYRALERPAEETRREPRPSRPPSPLRASRPPPSPSRPPSQRPATEGRYAPARPAAIFGASAKPASTTIFGAELFGDKSLDEVILSYLAEDLDPPHGK